MRFTELKRHIAQSIDQKNFYPCYLAAGDDAYLVQKAEEMLCAVVQFKEMNVALISDSAGRDELYRALDTPPFMSPYRLIVLDGKRFKELTEYLKAPHSGVVVLMKGVAAVSVAGAELIDCSRLTAQELSRSIMFECDKNGVSIGAQAAEMLAEYCGRSMGRVKNELYKLMDAGEGIINAEMIRALVQPELEYKVFELTDAIVKKETQCALTILEDMLSEGYGAAPKVYGLLYSHFKRLLAVSLSPNDENLKNYLGVKDFAVIIAARQAKAFSKIRLKTLVDKLHALDFGIKTGKAGDRVGLTAFVVEAADTVVSGQ
ncbi:MAG: DNA polymerase III subunit delta [Firmicutes bacterium]|nr:DNA polymerase III subunit delta [Bacillota bacterium]